MTKVQIWLILGAFRTSVIAQLVKNTSAMQDTLGWESHGLGRPGGEGIGYPLQYPWASLVAQLVKNPPAMQEFWVWSMGWEDPLEKGMATLYPVFLPGEFHGLCSPWRCKEWGMTEWLSLWGTGMETGPASHPLYPCFPEQWSDMIDTHSRLNSQKYRFMWK